MLNWRKDDVVDTYHGVRVADPYRWLEDPNDPDTRLFIEEQNRLVQNTLGALPDRSGIRARMTEIFGAPRYRLPQTAAGRYFYLFNPGLENQPSLYVSERLGGEARLLLDPNRLSDEGTVALTGFWPSRDGGSVAYALSRAGSDWREIRVLDAKTGQDRGDSLHWNKFSPVAWHPDGYGFYYVRSPEPGTVAGDDSHLLRRVFFHELGGKQSDDLLVYERPEARGLGFDPKVTEDGRYLILHVWEGTLRKNRIYYRAIGEEGEFVRLLDRADANYEFIGNEGPRFYFRTDHSAPRGRVIRIDTSSPEPESWETVLPEGEDTLEYAALAGGRLVAAHLEQASHRLRIFDLQGSFLREVPLPSTGSLTGVDAHPDDPEVRVLFTSFLHPGTVLSVSVEDGRAVDVFGGAPAVDPEDFEVKRAEFPSRDGTLVSMFVFHRRGIELDGSRPALVNGYGGFSISMTPDFAPYAIDWVERGGVFAQVQLRGGGEYGEHWHEAGILEKKQNVFDDFIAAAEWLADRGYTRRGRIASKGGSNGGLLVAACMLQRPDLYGAVVCQVPVADMLRYHRFTIGRFWVREYGNAEEDPEHFWFLYRYSPLHNVRLGTVYPPILITTAESDDRVVPAHSLKFAATLQESAGAQTLLRVERDAGHGMGKPVSKVIEENVDILGFLYSHLMPKAGSKKAGE